MTAPVRIQHLPANFTGRDFFVGDIHGCLDAFEEQLAAIGFDPHADRMFSVGDLVDRGSQPIDTLRLLRAPWFHCVMGNHEAMLLDSLIYLAGDDNYIEAHRRHLINGGGWVRTVAWVDDLPDLAARVQSLPHIIVISGETPSERVNIVHAELPDTVDDTDIDEGLPGVDPAELMWSRRIMGTAKELPTHRPGLSRTLCGHTPGKTVRYRLSHECLDTGCFATGILTVSR